MSDNNEPVKFDDWAEGGISREKANSAQLVLKWQKFDAKAMMWLRIGSLSIALFLSGWFLCKGLIYAEAAIYSVVKYDVRNTEQTESRSTTDAEQQQEQQQQQQQQQQADSALPGKSVNTEQDWDKALISSGSIITLIALVLGVGLTLLLAVVKLSIAAFKTEEQTQDYVGLTGPFSELLMQLANWLKNRQK